MSDITTNKLTAKCMLGDCLTMMQNIPDHSVDMVLCDLPFGKTVVDWDQIIDMKLLWEQYTRVLKSDGITLLFGDQPFASMLLTTKPEWYRYEIIWEKSKASGWLNAKRRPMVAHTNIGVFSAEDFDLEGLLHGHTNIEVFSQKAPRYLPQMNEGTPYNKGLVKAQSDRDIYGKYERVVVKSEDGKRYPRSVVYFKTCESETDYPTLHKSQKPQELLRYLIRSYTQPGETVLDNTAGSFATCVAALHTGRNTIGIELDPDFYAKGTRWLQNEAWKLGEGVEVCC